MPFRIKGFSGRLRAQAGDTAGGPLVTKADMLDKQAEAAGGAWWQVRVTDGPASGSEGFIQAAELAVRHLSSVTQTPPHFVLGQIANVSAEALEQAETSLARKVEQFKVSFGESWERVFRIALEMLGEEKWNDHAGNSKDSSAYLSPPAKLKLFKFN